MTTMAQKLIGISGGRVARNIYFWAMMFYSRLDFENTPMQVLYTAVLFGLLMVLFYTNNLLLIPRYLSRNKYGIYFLQYTTLCLLVSAIYVAIVKQALGYYGYHPGSISSLVMSGETGTFTIPAFFTEWLPYFMALFLAGCVFAMSWYVMDHQRQQKHIAEVKKEHLQMELAFLKNQINPHFLFNTLNNLYALTTRKSDNAPEVVSKISNMLRYMLYESDTQVVSFEKEREAMQAYIDLTLLGLARKDDMHFSITADKHYNIPPLLWLPVLENAFKYGTGFISDSYFIDYRFSIENNMLHIYSCNTFKAQQVTDAKGIGLSNLSQRLRLLFNNGHTLQRTIDGNRYITDIKIDITAHERTNSR